MNNREIIIATDETIHQIVKEEIYKYGWKADLNHIDVSKVTDMNRLFSIQYKYDKLIHDLTKFNGNISQWNVSNVKFMYAMFSDSKFTKNLTNWKPYKADIDEMFDDCNAPIPYWHIKDLDERKLLIDNFVEKQKLNDKLNNKLNNDLSIKNKGVNKI